MAQTLREPENEFVAFWNDVLVPKFVRYKHVLVGGLSQHSDAIFPRLEVNPGERVLDAGAGFGDTAIMLARRVGPSGHVTAMDCCDAFLDFGRRDAAAAGIANVDFVEADVQTAPFAADRDLVFSRFGTMFFQSPVAAMRNLGRALKPGGRFTMIVWRRIEDNPWLGAAKAIALRHLPPPGEDAQTCGPGPFSMASEDLVRAQMKAAGLERVSFERVDAPVRMGDSIEDAIGFQMALGPAGEVVREAGEVPEATRAAIEADLAELLAPHVTADGIYMGSSSWVVSARKPQ
ncbi:MAG TPA: class I SAM-dependent methyltransferase [Amaricoccus sp.]|uniref:class I SAM-dependent methyltransferase n=1 Tax=Amaricoccus sp. TaxID=1872485 RepID=UPI001DABA0DE|nr:class I SAM-dependent methyltransferase [Amaricoccus sp.]MCB1373660.1 class I SAM-dependent methyltransferase [Paracoccaceae bacterium]MCC0065892.1 class I SAM-dependent methyltransferase [Rhodovulum sp.]MCB1401524.1 class I SAM-dependent methyltransferase [Paracoccaceae bacterium]HPG22075.1 class I SAM-dependent methyltransferase [Amaricoccus sp.]HRW15912.1 class I SAM-dependent methyltransferase [Amaricoccus sp.]